MRYIKPPVATVCVGSAFGEAAMLLAAGEPGRRAALPSASIMIRQPMQRFTQMQASDIDIYRNELRKTNAEVVSAGRMHVQFCYLWWMRLRAAPASALGHSLAGLGQQQA